MKCVICGKEFEKKHHRELCCSAECKKIKKRNVSVLRGINKKECEMCGKLFTPTGRAKFCSDECRNLLHKSPYRKKAKITSITEFNRIAHEMGLSYGELQLKISRKEIEI